MVMKTTCILLLVFSALGENLCAQVNVGRAVIRNYCERNEKFAEYLLSKQTTEQRLTQAQPNNIAFSALAENVNDIIKYGYLISITPNLDSPSPECMCVFRRDESGQFYIVFVFNESAEFGPLYLSFLRELQIASRLVKLINNGDINIDTAYNDFKKLYREGYESSVASIKTFFDTALIAWMRSENLTIKSSDWKDHFSAIDSKKLILFSEAATYNCKMLYSSMVLAEVLKDQHEKRTHKQ